jgi:hypothetical protein
MPYFVQGSARTYVAVATSGTGTPASTAGSPVSLDLGPRSWHAYRAQNGEDNCPVHRRNEAGAVCSEQSAPTHATDAVPDSIWSRLLWKAPTTATRRHTGEETSGSVFGAFLASGSDQRTPWQSAAALALFSETLLLVASTDAMSIWIAERILQPVSHFTDQELQLSRYGRIRQALWGPSCPSRLSGIGLSASIALLTEKGIVLLLTLSVKDAPASPEEALRPWWKLADDDAAVEVDDWRPDKADGGAISGIQPSAEARNTSQAQPLDESLHTDHSRCTWTLALEHVASVALSVAKEDASLTSHALAMTACPAGVIVASASGWVECISWNASTIWKVEIFGETLTDEQLLLEDISISSREVHVHYDQQLRLGVLCFQQQWLVLLQLDCGGYCRPHCAAPSVRFYRYPGLCCVALEPRHGLIGLGMADGSVRVHHLESMALESVCSGAPGQQHAAQVTRRVRSLSWAPDGEAFALAWDERGLAIWSRHGCRLFSSSSWIGPQSQSQSQKHQSAVAVPATPEQDPLRVRSVHWHPTGLSIFVQFAGEAPNANAALFGVLPLLRLTGEFGGSSVWEGNRIYPTACAVTDDAVGIVSIQRECADYRTLGAQVAQLLLQQCAEGVLHGRRSTATGWHWMTLDEAYLRRAWPIRHVAWQAASSFLAVSGTSGVALWNPQRRRWRWTEPTVRGAAGICIGLAWLGPFLLTVWREDAPYELLKEERFRYYAPTNVLAQIDDADSRMSARKTSSYTLRVFHRSKLGEERLSKPLRFRHRPLKIDVLESGIVWVYNSDSVMRVYRFSWEQRRPWSSSVDWRFVHSLPLRVDYGIQQTSVDGEWLESFRVLPSRVLSQAGETEHAFLLPFGAWPGSILLSKPHRAATETADSLASSRADQPFSTQHSPPSADSGSTTSPLDASRDHSALSQAPDGIPRSMLLVLGSRGTLFIVDPLTQAEDVLASAVIRYWFTADLRKRHSVPQPALWVSTANGVYAMSSARFTLRHCIEFDAETFLCGMMSSIDALVGVTATRVRYWDLADLDGQPFLYEASLKAWPVLPMILKLLLEDGADDLGVTHVALRNAQQPQFMDALEWLLYRTAVAESKPKGDDQEQLSLRVVRMLRKFGEYEDIVVHCARKTEAYKWPSLFALVGEPTALLEQCFLSGRLRTAACLLIVLQELHGLQASAFQALRLFQAALSCEDDALARELMGYLARISADEVMSSGSCSAREHASAHIPQGGAARSEKRDHTAGQSASRAGKVSGQLVESGVDHQFFRMAETSLFTYATELLWRFELYRLCVLAERLGFSLTEWLRRNSTSHREFRDLYLGITSARQQFRVGTPSSAAVQRAILDIQHAREKQHVLLSELEATRRRLQALNPSLEHAAKNVQKTAAAVDHCRNDRDDHGNDVGTGTDHTTGMRCRHDFAADAATALAISIPSVIYLKRLAQAAYDVDYPSLGLILDTLLLHGQRIYLVLQSHPHFQEPYLLALRKFDEPSMSALLGALQQAL